MKTSESAKSSGTEPAIGTRNQKVDSASTSSISTKPMAMYGSVLPTISSAGVIGVTTSCSSVPISRSLTIAIEVSSIVTRNRIIEKTPGTM